MPDHHIEYCPIDLRCLIITMLPIPTRNPLTVCNKVPVRKNQKMLWNKDFEFYVRDQDIASLSKVLKCLIEISGFWPIWYALVSCLLSDDATAQNIKYFSFRRNIAHGTHSERVKTKSFHTASTIFHQFVANCAAMLSRDLEVGERSRDVSRISR